MQIKLTLNAPVDYLYQQLIDSARADIQQQTGRPAPRQSLQGYEYDKQWSNGLTGNLKITHAQPGVRYAYELETPRDHYGVDYQFATDADGHQTVLEYAETFLGKDKKTNANNKLGVLFLGWFRKRRFKKMMNQMAASYNQ